MNNNEKSDEQKIIQLSKADLQDMLNQAADRALKQQSAQLYELVGHSVIEKGAYIIGLAAVAVWVWLSNNGTTK